MKLVLILALASSAANAANWNPQASYDLGSKFLDRQQTARKIDYMLNPIFCFSESDNSLALIFSDDFRNNQDAYLINNGSLLRKAITSSLGLVRHPLPSTNRDFMTESVVLGRERLNCVTSATQLE